jgi:glucuronokinase
MAFSDRSATVRISPAEACRVGPAPPERLDFTDLGSVAARLASPDLAGGERLLRAALLRFGRSFPELRELAPKDPGLHFAMQFESTIPLQVGLAGSSAIIIAALRALSLWFAADLPEERLAAMALAAEVEELGITAGPMDRLSQAFGGVLLMDFSEAPGAHRPRRVPEEGLPPLLVAWDPSGSEPSGAVHQDVRERWLAGDAAVCAAMARLPELVDEGMRALVARDTATFQAAVNANFDTRASIWNVRPQDDEMIAIARDRGAAAKFAGSGGAVVAVLRSEDERPDLEAAYAETGYKTLRPTVTPETGSLT